jgi:hypothetical protein
MHRKHTRTIWLAGAVLALALLPVEAAARYNSFVVAEPFASYYDTHQGMRVLGLPLSDLTEASGYSAQYFEKGRIEDHRIDVSDPRWAIMYGRLTVELTARDPGARVSGTNLTYGEVGRASAPSLREAPPPGFTGGTRGVHDGMFVPFDPYLRPAPGYVVAPYFWAYINRAELFPAGWLHDIGLPVTGVFTTEVVKGGEGRTIFVQAFERAVLTYDMRNPAGWQVEKGNIGADFVRGIMPPAAPLDLPVDGARVMLPLHILMHAGTPGEQVTAALVWGDGTRLSNTFTVLRGEDGKGLITGNLDWVNMLAPPQPATQAATLEVRTSSGAILTTRWLIVVAQDDPGTQELLVYWTVSGNDDIVVPQHRRVVKTTQPAAAALEELLWGPPTISQIGYGTALPTPQQVLAYPGREPDWGPRVTLRKVTITDGVATADFSREMRAYGGGSLRVKLIRDQITQTLRQFPTVSEVRIAIEGETEGVLEP